MNSLVLPVATLLAAIGLTYVFCIRPMRKVRCATTRPSAPDVTAGRGSEQAEIEAARAQLAALRATQPASRDTDAHVGND
ncbi:hypothetical protein [Sporichthya sp.]|uniref:hypothetical protein n=1 Tax=Sporichthya sp. TaxID=65475 RepID=UPI0018147318|nr:hypothetical protein [Sporichthya sp.]MBA3741620.1 hypothetical protein [Sporichthya sp.]